MEALGEVHRLISCVLDVLKADDENKDDAIEMVQFCEAFREVVSHFPQLPADVKKKMMPLMRVLEKTLQQAEAWLLRYNQRKFTIMGKEVPQIPGLRKLRKLWMARSWQSHMNKLHVKFQTVNSGISMIAVTWQYVQSSQDLTAKGAQTLMGKVSELCDHQAQLAVKRQLSKSPIAGPSYSGIDIYSL